MVEMLLNRGSLHDWLGGRGPWLTARTSAAAKRAQASEAVGRKRGLGGRNKIIRVLF